MSQKWRYLVCIIAGIFVLGSGLGCDEGEDIDSGSITSNESSTADDDDGTGNGAPTGPHYTLNIIGSLIEKQPDLNNVGRRIFPPLVGTTKIMLVEGTFRMLDGNGTDGPAQFQLPNPDPENDGVLAYTVWARTMATPVGTSTTTACATDPNTGEEYCSNQSLKLSRTNGKPMFRDVSDQLLYIYADINKDGIEERYPLFDEALVDYYWFYDNDSLKHAQLRFYGDCAGDDDDDDDDDDGDDDDDNGDDDDDDDDTDTDVVV